jgi:NADH dehydrogenase
VYVVGDMISLKHYPGVAQVAIQGGKYAAHQIERRLTGRAPKGDFRYFDKGSMATISRFRAVASIGRFRFFGFLAWLLWLGVHIVYLVGFKNRVATVFHWAVSFLGNARTQRSGVLQQALVHPAADADRPADSGQVESAKVDSGQIESAKVDSGQIESAKIESGQAGSGEQITP